MSITYEIAKLSAKHDAMIKVEVPAKQGRKAYSYMREGGEGEKKTSGKGKKVAIAATVGGLGLAAALGTAAAMKAKKEGEGRLGETDLRGKKLTRESKTFFQENPEALDAHKEVNGLFREYMRIFRSLEEERMLVYDKVTESGAKILSNHPAFSETFETEKFYVAAQYLQDEQKKQEQETDGNDGKAVYRETLLYRYLDKQMDSDKYSIEDVDELYTKYVKAVNQTDYKENIDKIKNISKDPKTQKLAKNMFEKANQLNALLDRLKAPSGVRRMYLAVSKLF